MSNDEEIVILSILAIVTVLVAIHVNDFLLKPSYNSTKSPKVTESTESETVKDVQDYYTEDKKTFRLFDYLEDCGLNDLTRVYCADHVDDEHKKEGVVGIEGKVNGWLVQIEEGGEIIIHVDRPNPDFKTNYVITFYNIKRNLIAADTEENTYLYISKELIKDLPNIVKKIKKEKALFGKNPFPDNVPIQRKEE